MNAHWRPVAIALLILIYLAVTVAVAVPVTHGEASVRDELWFGGLLAIGILALLTVVLAALGLRIGDLVLGTDKRLSTSKLQVLFWTYGLAGVLLAIVIAKWAGADAGYDSLINQSLPEEYLILLGGPFAAAVASKAIVSGQVDSGKLAKTEGQDQASAKDRAAEAVSDDKGNTSLVDTQYLLFNLVALTYMIGAYIDDPSAGLPKIPAVLVGLTSVAAATYVSNKAIQSETPVLTSLFPARGKSDDTVQVFGRYLLVPREKKPGEEQSYESVYVAFGGVEAKLVGVDERQQSDPVKPVATDEHRPLHQDTGDDRLWVKVPEGLPTPPLKVDVRNFKGTASNQLDFDVAS